MIKTVGCAGTIPPLTFIDTSYVIEMASLNTTP